MIDENYDYLIDLMIKAKHFKKDESYYKCNHCGIGIIGETLMEIEGAMRCHLEQEHGIKI